MDLFVRSHQHSKTLTDEEFWELIHTIDHEYKGDSEAVVSSLIRHLKKCEDEYIFAFYRRHAVLGEQGCFSPLNCIGEVAKRNQFLYLPDIMELLQ